MKKFLASVLTFCLSAVIMAQVAVAAAQVGYVNTTVRFRSEPKQDASYSSTVYVGSTVTIVSENNGWYKVEFGGKTGYIKTKYVTVNKTKTSSGTQSSKATTPGKPSSGTGYVKVAVRYRNEPKQDAKSSMTLYPGTLVKVQSTTDGWCKVEYKKTIGYIKSDYLYIKAGTQSGVTSGIGTLKVAVRYRNEPKQDASHSAKLYPGYEVKVLSITDGWCKVEYKGTIGYIKEQYLYIKEGETPKEAEAKAPATPKLENGIGRVKTAVRFRKEPKQDAISIGRLYYGDEVTVLSTTDGWCKCKHGSKIGYIKAQYLDIRAIPAPDPTPVLTPVDSSYRGTGKTNTSVRFRNTPYESSPSQYTLYPGYECYVLEKQGDWVVCEYRGSRGYVKAKYIELKKAAIKPLTEPGGSPIKTGKINAKNIYLKLGPGYTYETVRTLAQNEEVTVYESSGDWYRIISKQGDGGYVPKSAVTP